MKQLATKVESDEATTCIGEVTRVEGGPRPAAVGARTADGPTIWVRLARGEVRARRAVGCLVAPEPEDCVLVALAEGGSAYVLSVLERAHGAPATVLLERDLRVRAPAGRIDLAAQEGVGIASARGIAITSAELDIKAVEGRVGASRFTFVSDLVAAEVDRAKVVAASLDAVAERVVERVKRSYRFIEELEQVKAKYLDVVTEKVLRLHGRNAVVTADELVKMDGQQIHMG